MNNRQFGQAPKAINCPLCNGKYFKKSFPIHFEQCKELHKKTHQECRRCHREIHIDEIVMHQEHCFAQKAPIPKKKKSTPKHISNGMSNVSEFMESDGNDYRIECKFCHRKFNPDRIEKHESICNKLKPEGITYIFIQFNSMIHDYYCNVMKM